MRIIDNVLCLIAIAISFLNAYFIKCRAGEEIARNPELKEGYDKLIRGFLVCMNIPWVIMGIGILAGRVNGLLEYFYPSAGNPYVLFFHITMVVLWILGAYWICFGGGAEFLVRHPGALSVDIKSPLVLKLLFALGLIVGTVAITSLWLKGLPPDTR